MSYTAGKNFTFNAQTYVIGDSIPDGVFNKVAKQKMVMLERGGFIKLVEPVEPVEESAPVVKRRRKAAK